MNHTDKTILYLAAIKKLNQDSELMARQKHIIKELNISPSTCSEAMSKLIRKQLVREDNSRVMHLTSVGKDLLTNAEQNHSIFRYFFREVLNQCCEDAENQALKIEPHLSLETNLEMCRFVNFLKTLEGKKVDFWKEWNDFLLDPETDPICQKCAYKKTCLKRRAAS